MPGDSRPPRHLRSDGSVRMPPLRSPLGGAIAALIRATVGPSPVEDHRTNQISTERNPTQGGGGFPSTLAGVYTTAERSWIQSGLTSHHFSVSLPAVHG